jgi:hypothetical protein
MAATFTATGYNATPRALHAGVSVQTFNFSYAGRSASVSDVIFIGRLPNGVQVIDGWISGKPGSDGSCTWKVGIPGNDVFFAPAAVSITTSGNTIFTGQATKYPKQISLSADAEGLLYQPVIVTKSTGTSTATGSIQLVLLVAAPPV